MDAREYYYQVDNVEYIKNKLGTEQWTQVCGHQMINDTEAAFWCGLVDAERVPAIKSRCSWDIGRGTGAYPGFEQYQGTTVYKKCLLDEGYEPIIFDREFYGIRTDYIELSQEFILLNNLYLDTKKHSYYAIKNNGECEEVVRYEDEERIYIRTQYLYRYATAKQKHLVLYYDMHTELSGSLSEYNLEPFEIDYSDEYHRYALWGNELSSSHKNKAYSVLMGKKLFPITNVEKCGYWPYEPEKKYEDYIIGADSKGELIMHSCNPDTLNNFFNANPNEPLYFTPVFFRKEVLQKYISRPELYEITDGRLTCRSLWSVEIDNHHAESDVVSVFLGDLGTYLPEEEQRLWKVYNIASDKGISGVTFKRDFCCSFVDSNMEDHRFQSNYVRINEKWKEKLGWPLFLPLSVTDEYNLNGIRIPVLNNQQEFDSLVLSLVKVLIDSINEKELLKQANVPADQQATLKGIGKLEVWLNSKQAKAFEDHIQFLRDLQELRSAGTGHRKGKGYDKISKKFHLDEKTYAEVFTNILKQANQFIEYMKDIFIGKIDDD